MSVNKVFLVGNLTRDPEVRQTASGMYVLGVGMAVNDRVKDGDGDWADRPNFVDLTMFGSRAQAVSQHLHKGDKVAVEGKLRYSSWERDGQKRSRLEVVVDEIEFMTAARQQADRQLQAAYQPQAAPYQPQARIQCPQAPQQAAYQPNAAPQAQQQMDTAYYGEDVPF